MPDDTIVAIATPPGRAGIGVVRISGARALEIASGLIHLPKIPPQVQHATRGDFVDPRSGSTLDQVVLTYFQQPHSYTGEDVVEISCHGAPVILKYLLERSTISGARLAEPGEFTMRAFLNGRIDLTQAEAIRDLIDSRTLYQAQVAAQQIGGAVSARLSPPKEAMIELIARLEAGIDFAEDDVPVSQWEEIISRIDVIRGELARMAQGYEFGRIIREGLGLAIVGRPNVGKSSLFNRLLNQDRAIVTSMPGTTRDLVSETASIGGIPVRLVDTAGIRETADQVEKLGVERSLQALADSDLRLLVADASEGWTEEDERLFQTVQPLGRVLVAINKCDLVPHPLPLSRLRERGERAEVEACAIQALPLPACGRQGTAPQLGEGFTPQRDSPLAPLAGFTPGRDSPLALHSHAQPLSRLRERGDRAAVGEGGVRGYSSAPGSSQAHDAAAAIPSFEPVSTAHAPAVWTSALTGEGLPELQELILSLAAPARELNPEGEVITNLRHQDCLRQALDSLSKAREAAARRTPHEMLLLDLYDALHALGTLTGATTTEDLLGVIFSTFCVGK
jgi:tRNA modification GTPase